MRKSKILKLDLSFRDECKYYKKGKCLWFKNGLVKKYYKTQGFSEQYCRDNWGGCKLIIEGICCFNCRENEICQKSNKCINFLASVFNPSKRENNIYYKIYSQRIQDGKESRCVN